MGTERTERYDEWTDSDSQVFMRFGQYYIPGNDEHLRILQTVIEGHPAVRLLELGCGDGTLLSRLDNLSAIARVTLVDASQEMLTAAASKLDWLANIKVRQDDLSTVSLDADSYDVAFSRLAIHHLDDLGKKRIYAKIARALSADGVFVLVDLIQPTSAAAVTIAEQQWDIAVQSATRGVPDGDEALDVFRRQGWNHFALADPDPIDKPSSIEDNAQWLRSAGFAVVDVVWMSAGHAAFVCKKESSDG